MQSIFIYPRPSRLILAASLALAVPAACGDSESGGDGGGGPCVTTSDCGADLVCYQGTCVDDDFSPGLDEEEREGLGEGLGGGDEPTGYGEIIDSFCGINAYQNGPNVGYAPYTGPFGYEYQCTEMAYRFTCEYFDMCEKKAGAYGNAKSWYTNDYKDPVLTQMTRFPNGGTEPPRPGDILAAGDGIYGHVAIVKYVKDGYVHVLEQNVYKGSHKYSITIKDGHYTMAAKWQGWMRAPKGPATCGDEQSDCATGSFLGIPTINGGILHVEGTIGAPKGILKYSLVIGEDTVFTQDFPQPGPMAAPFNVDIDLAGQQISPGMHTLGLWVKDVEQCTGGAAVDVADLVIMGDECGDGAQDASEDCDGYDLGGKSCTSLGYSSGSLGCSPTCTFDISACKNDGPVSCPNGQKDANEQCDGADLGGKSCTSLGWSGGSLGCSPACMFDTSSCTSDEPIMCPDNKKEGNEQCDGNDFGGASCTSLGYSGGSLACTASCKLDTSGCMNDVPAPCPNGKKDPGEDCDGADLGGASCVSQGFSGGSLNCSGSCSFDTSECTDEPMCTYNVNPKAPASSSAAPYNCPGGIVMPVSGSLDAQGNLTVSSPGKPDGYGAGNYRVVVFDPNADLSQQCKPFNAVKATKVLNQKANSITFPAFASLLQCGGAAKAYCIQKEDGGNVDHFCSGKLVASYQ